MAAPYPVDPNKGVNPGWAVPGAPNTGYPTQPPPNMGYPTQPGGVYPPPAPGAYQPPATGVYPPQAPPPYTAQPGFGGQPGGYAQPVYNASGGGFPIQDGAGHRGGDAAGVPKDDILPAQFGGSFDDKAIRHAFIRKVYLILMVQLLLTLIIVSLFTFHAGVRSFVQHNTWVYFLSYAVFLVTYLSLVCCSGVRRRWPGNFIMLGIFTLSLSYMAGTIASTYNNKVVIMTIGITCAICLLITLFATQTKYDFTGCGIYLFVAGMVMFIFGIIAIFTYSRIMYTIYSAGIALLFSMYLVYDTQLVVGGRKHEMSPEEHIYGALTLYLDIVYIFISLLSVFGSKN